MQGVGWRLVQRMQGLVSSGAAAVWQVSTVPRSCVQKWFAAVGFISIAAPSLLCSLEPILAQLGLLPSSARGAAGEHGTPVSRANGLSRKHQLALLVCTRCCRDRTSV